MKAIKIGYYVSTGIFTVMMLFSSGMYFFNHAVIVGFFQDLGFPTWIIYPLAVAKLLALLAIWYRKFQPLKEWAYAGLVFDLLLATTAHLAIADGNQAGSIIVLVAVVTSRILEGKLPIATSEKEE